MSNKAYTMVVEQIICDATADPDSVDDVIILLAADGDLPIQFPLPGHAPIYMSADGLPHNGQDTVNIVDPWVNGFEDSGHLSVQVDRAVIVSLWDQDTSLDPDLNDFLGSQGLHAGPDGYSQTYSFTNGDDSAYRVGLRWFKNTT